QGSRNTLSKSVVAATQALAQLRRASALIGTNGATLDPRVAAQASSVLDLASGSTVRARAQLTRIRNKAQYARAFATLVLALNTEDRATRQLRTADKDAQGANSARAPSEVAAAATLLSQADALLAQSRRAL